VLDDRKLAVLRAVVEDYVSTHEPVGSKAIVERYRLGVSAATVRNEMAALEDEGYIAQPHTSAGRIPTDLGYRMFVNRLNELKPMSPAEQRAIAQFLQQAVDLDDVMVRTTRLLAQLTRQVAIVQYPSLQRSLVRHIELVPVAGRRVMVVVIADTGRVEQRIAEVPLDVEPAIIEMLRGRLNAAVAGKSFVDVTDAVTPLLEDAEFGNRPVVAAIISCLLESVVERSDDRVVVAGAANLARYGAVFDTSVAPLLEALEEHVVLLRLLGESSTGDDVLVRIGVENTALPTSSVVAAGYGSAERTVAQLGVVGPTHMDYSGTMRAVHAVARYVGRLLTEA
jgi:heat-inducible transcriptional repressor